MSKLEAPTTATTLRANQVPCPDCPDLSPRVIVNATAGTFDLEIDAYANFDYTGVSEVELDLKEGIHTATLELSFGPADVENGIDEEDLELPSAMTGSGLQATVVFFEPNDARVDVPATVTP